jgi:hypothetical protein
MFTISFQAIRFNGQKREFHLNLHLFDRWSISLQHRIWNFMPLRPL